MRQLIAGSLSVAAAAMIATRVPAATPTTAPTTQRSMTVTAPAPCVMRSGSADVLRLILPAGSTCEAKDGWLAIGTPPGAVNVWLAKDAKNVDAAIGTVPKLIASEFTDFKAEKTTDLTVARSPAKRLVGAGHEADDGDAGAADVIVFQVGGHVFVAVTHGETLKPDAQAAMLTLVQTAQVP